MTIKFFKEKEGGFTIIELIIAIAVLSFGILGTYEAFYAIFSRNQNVSIRFSAVYLAQEGMEIIRNLRDKNFITGADWSAGLLDCETGCQADYKTGTAAQSAANQIQPYSDSNFLKISGDGFYGYDIGSDSIFKRKITINKISGTEILKVSSRVMWDYRGEQFNFTVDGYIYNWH